MLTFEKLVEEFRELGVMKGDVLFIHSSYKSFGGVEGGPQTVINALLDVIGVEGTLIMPTFNYDFLKGTPGTIRNTPRKWEY
jgi:aminoglycoside 3-N-acetyltransferase